MSFLYTIVSAENCTLNKFYTYTNGVVNKTAIANMSRGSARVSSYENFQEFSLHLANLKSNEAIVLGVPSEGRTEVTLVTKGNEDPEKNIISKSNDYFIFVNPSTGLIDYDTKGIPEHLKVKTVGELKELIVTLVPELADKAIYIKPSSSSGLILPNGMAVSSDPSFHAYFTMNNLNEESLKKLLDNIYWNAIKNNKTFLKIFKNGGSTLSTPIDEAVLKSMQSRLIFESQPTLQDGLTKIYDPGMIYNGETMQVLDLDTLKARDVKKIKNSLLQLERVKNASVIAQMKKEYAKNKRIELQNKGYDEQTIDKIVTTHVEKSMLNAKESIIVDQEGEKPIIEAIFSVNGRYIADPLEPEKGYARAVFNASSIFNAGIYSYLDGGKTYKIDFEFEDIKTVISDVRFDEKLFNGGVNKELVALMSDKHLSLEQTNEIISILASKNLIDTTSFKNKVLYEIIDKKACDIMQNYAFIQSKGKTGIIKTDEHGLNTYSLADIKLSMKNKHFFAINPETGKNKKYDPVEIWIASKNRTDYYNIEFIKTKNSKPNTYEIFTGFKYAPINSLDISSFWTFIFEVICSKDLLFYNIIITFFAQIIQQPHLKHNTALVLLDEKGIGKSTLVHAMSKLICQPYFILRTK
jgi:hypothetical protein